MAYITKTEIEKFTGLTIDAGMDTFITTLISAAQNFIENFTGRFFEAPDPDSDETRYYNGNGATKLKIDDLREITSLVVAGETLVEDDDFLLYPLNEDPKEWIELIQPETQLAKNTTPRSFYANYTFTKGQATVEVTGKFGYSDTPPEDIKLAALKLVAGMIKENIGDSDVKELKSETLGDYSATYVDVKNIANALGIDTLLEQYIRDEDLSSGKTVGGQRMIR